MVDPIEVGISSDRNKGLIKNVGTALGISGIALGAAMYVIGYYAGHHDGSIEAEATAQPTTDNGESAMGLLKMGYNVCLFDHGEPTLTPSSQ